ncbi:general substrate transporter [Aaosphaeria arxii CBS 175.79]|uniref:General substrate transporter n=1 Tax=Aaosphaeria arxii CBS 175.79 TaxID=1450172 RepID=A0A6A5XSY9_9PLEO|nr:general substrate transporter [Aaosphaeria arxii CBS 175.79]KAF2016312.1 general substrate transporter [Aaosphaeria arxii CBS 175.79]
MMEKTDSETVVRNESISKSGNPVVVDEAALLADRTDEEGLTFRYVMKNHPSLVWWSFFYAMSAVGWGFDAQVNGAMISVPAFRRDFGYIFEGQPVLPAVWQTSFNVVSSVGQFFGGFLCAWTADRIGRKYALAIGAVVCAGGIVGQVVTASKVGFLMSKLVLGFGLGFYLSIGPLVTSEITPVVLRGLATAGVNLGIALGQLLSNAAVKGFGERDDRWAYRGPFALQLFFAVFLLAGVWFAPESPWYLVRKGRYEEAEHAMQQLWGAHKPVAVKVAAMKASHESHAEAAQPSILECFRGTNLIRTGISTGVFVCQHLVGIIFVLGYSSYFFQLAGLDPSRSFDLGVGVTACGVLGNILSWFTVNRYGRRSNFLLGMCVLTALLLLIGIMDVVPSSGAKWVQAAATVIYAFVYFNTIGALAFVLLGETSNPSLRGNTTALATATQSALGIAMNIAIPYMVNPDEANLKGKVGFVFGGLAALATVGCFFYVPELKGKSFDQINTLFEKKVPPRHMGKYTAEDIDHEVAVA